MSLTDQQFRKLLAKGIKERKAYERAFRSANLLKEGYAPYNEENEAHEQRIATMLDTNESKTLTESQDPIQAALDELIILLNQTSHGDYRSQIENIIRILNPDVGGQPASVQQPYQLQPVEFKEQRR